MKRTLVKSCCGSKGYVFELDAPLSKSALSTFKQAGYNSSETYTKVGVFYVEKNGLTATGPYGSTKIQVRCGGSSNCSQLLDGLENTFKIVSQIPAP
jgi:hypothetical protein